MKAKLRATVTIVQEYEADYKDCDCVADMIDLDKANFESHPLDFIDSMFAGEYSLKVKIEKAKE